MVQREYLVPQHRKPVEVLGPFLVLDARDRRLQPRDVRFDRHGRAIAEPPLHAVARDLQEPSCGGRCAQPNRREEHSVALIVLNAVREQLQPQREQRIGQRRRHA